jgi:tripartite-type tricarboxylate transporter receptor subunit TctC
VPFRGDAPVLPTLLKGDIDFGAPAVSTIHGQNFRPLLVFWQARHPAYPDVPLARELGAASEVCRPATTASTRQADCRSLRRRRWSGIAPMP